MLSLIKSPKLAAIIAVAAFIIFGLCAYFFLFGAPQKHTRAEQFTNSSPSTNTDLKAQGFVKSALGFKIAFALSGGREVQAGAYLISKSMNAWQVAKILKGKPNLIRVTIPEGLRKEEVANILAGKLDWNDEQKDKWITSYTALKLDYLEGVYFPDTYLIPVTEDPLAVAQRLQRHFEEEFAPYSQDALNQNIKWTTVLTLASIVQREAVGTEDMALIAGILWKRLNQGLPLQVDATIQYARDSLQHYGKEPGNLQSTSYISEGSWWSPININDKSINSPFNTYTHKGLPPHPIANPGLDAIKSVLFPVTTECLFYVHDSSGVIHCAKTYEEHQENIKSL